MLNYPAYVSVRHEDGRLETFNTKVAAESPEAAIERAYEIYLPRYKGEEGWTIAVVVDELLATEIGEES